MTLLEVVVATLVVLVALVPLVGLLTRNTQGVSVSLDEVEATTITTALLESLQAVPFEVLRPLEGTPGVPVGELPADLAAAVRVPETGERFELFVNIRSREVEDVDARVGLDPGLRDRLRTLAALRVVEVVCRYRVRAFSERAGASRPREIRLVTLVSSVGRQG